MAKVNRIGPITKRANEARIIVQTPEQSRKICKMFFTQTDSSLYIHCYSTSREPYYGVRSIPAYSRGLTFNFKAGKFAPRCPKLSYHESGRVHLKLENDEESVEYIQSLPMKRLDGNHIVTIIANTLERFEEYSERARGPHVLIQFPKRIETLKLTIWASAGQELKQYPFRVNLRRPTLSNVFFGIKAESQSPISQGAVGLTVITGWDLEATAASRPAKFLYLQGI